MQYKENVNRRRKERPIKNVHNSKSQVRPRQNMGILAITHNRHLAERIADGVWDLSDNDS